MLITNKHCVNKPDYNCLSAAYCSISSTCLPRAVCAPLWTFLLTGNHFMVDQSRRDMTRSLNRVEEEVKVQLWNVSWNWSWLTGASPLPPPHPPGRHHEWTCSVSYLDLLLLTRFFCKLMLWWWSQTWRETRNQMITKGWSPKFNKTNWTERTCKNKIGQNESIICNFLKKYRERAVLALSKGTCCKIFSCNTTNGHWKNCGARLCVPLYPFFFFW